MSKIQQGLKKYLKNIDEEKRKVKNNVQYNRQRGIRTTIFVALGQTMYVRSNWL